MDERVDQKEAEEQEVNYLPAPCGGGTLPTPLQEHRWSHIFGIAYLHRKRGKEALGLTQVPDGRIAVPELKTDQNVEPGTFTLYSKFYSDGLPYVGQTVDLRRRMKDHYPRGLHDIVSQRMNIELPTSDQQLLDGMESYLILAIYYPYGIDGILNLSPYGKQNRHTQVTYNIRSMMPYLLDEDLDITWNKTFNETFREKAQDIPTIPCTHSKWKNNCTICIPSLLCLHSTTAKKQRLRHCYICSPQNFYSHSNEIHKKSTKPTPKRRENCFICSPRSRKNEALATAARATNPNRDHINYCAQDGIRYLTYPQSIMQQDYTFDGCKIGRAHV